MQQLPIWLVVGRLSGGSIDDTYVSQVKSKKPKGNDNWDKDVKPNKHTPQIIGLSKSLGGGASVHFEHANPNQENKMSSTALALKIEF